MRFARHSRLVALLGLVSLFIGLPHAAAQAQPTFAQDAFQRVWTRTDQPVASGRAGRTWFWGPQPNSPGLLEAYSDAPDGSGQRLVQYFDKSRMEINNPSADPNSAFYVTNGLLTVELISGCIQVSNAPCGESRTPADIPMTGDAGDELAPTYAAFAQLSNTSAGDHPADNRTGQAVTATVARDGSVGDDQSKAGQRGTRITYYDATTRHNIPEAFWNFLNQSAPVIENGKLTVGPLINPWYYASGLPISEAYWARATIGGVVKDVMIQAFERRVLTFTPTNEPVWQVEMGNIGQHYYQWRYAGSQPQLAPGGPLPPAPTAQPTATQPGPSLPIDPTTTPVVGGGDHPAAAATPTAAP